MFQRYATAITSGSAMTFALLFVMHLLIVVQPSAIRAEIPPQVLSYAPPPRERPVQPAPQRIDRKLLTNVNPIPRVGQRVTNGPATGINIPSDMGSPPMEKLRPMQILDGPLVAMIRVQPSYPAGATARELEGYVVVEFDVLPNGTTANIRIVESSHGVFEKSSIKAAERFKFKPRIVNGQPQTSIGVQNIFRYEMSDE